MLKDNTILCVSEFRHSIFLCGLQFRCLNVLNLFFPAYKLKINIFLVALDVLQYIFFVNKQTKTCLQGVWHLPDNLDAFPSQAQKRTKLPEKWYGWVRQRLAEQLHVSIVCRWQKHSVIALILASSRDTKQHSEEQDELRFWSAHEIFPLIAPSSRCEEDSSDSWRISTLPPWSPNPPPPPLQFPLHSLRGHLCEDQVED